MRGPLHLNTDTKQATLSEYPKKHFHCPDTSIAVPGGHRHGAAPVTRNEQGLVPGFQQQPQRWLSRRP